MVVVAWPFCWRGPPTPGTPFIYFSLGVSTILVYDMNKLRFIGHATLTDHRTINPCVTLM